MKIRTMLGTAVLAAAVVVGFIGSPASAETVHNAPSTLKIGNTQYRTDAITAGIGFLDMNHGVVAIKPETRSRISTADFSELSRFVADTNASNKLAAGSAVPLSACTNKIRVSTNNNGIHVHLPKCAVTSTATVLASAAAIVVAAGNIDDISDKVAKAIGAVIAADAAILVGWSAACDIFGNGDIAVSLTWQLVPYPGCD